MRNIIHQILGWRKGVRLYIALASVLFTAEANWYVRTVYGQSSISTIRLQEIFAWTSLALILLTLAIGPLYKIGPKLPGKYIMRDARRLIGVSAAWFATWHVGISYINQFHAANPLHLPGVYQRSFSLGLIALLILVALAATSINVVIRSLGHWWFRLHRLIYVAVLLILAHAFMIGVHAASWPFLVTITVVIAGLFAMQLYLGFGPGREPTILRSIVLCYGLLLTVAVLAYGFTQHLGLSQIDGNNSGGQYGIR